MLKSLANLLWGEKKEGQVVRVEGSLFQGEDDVVFLRAEAVVQKGTRPFTSSLVVTRLYEEGEEPPAEGSDEVAELHFFVNPDMGFQYRNSEFSWADPEGRTFALVPTKGTSQHLLDLFEYSVLQGMYEMTYKTSSEEADEAEVLAFRNLKPKVQAAAAPKAPTTPQRPAAAATSSSSATPSRTPKPSTPAGREASPSKQHQFSPLPSVKQVQSPVLTRDTSELSGTTEVFGTQGNLYWFSPSDAMYNPLKEKATVSILRKNGRHFLLHVHDPATPRTYTLQPLTPDMNPIFYHNKPLSFSYSTEEDGKICSWGIKILFEGEERSFANTFGRCITEMSRDEDFDKLEVEQQQSLLRGYLSDDEMEDAEVESSEEEDEEDEEGETYEYSRSTNQDKNSHLTVSYNTDRSFVVRGNQIGVFKNTNDSLEFSTSINDVKTPKGKSFAPAKTMLHSQDKNMVLMDTSDPHSLYKMDLTRGEVVEEWKIDDYTEVKHFCPESKFAQRAPVDTFVGMSHNSIFMVDPRLPGNKQVKEQMKQYARDARNDFSSTATTEGGDLVVVSNKGDMRLFNNISKNAKTHLPGFGDPIIGVDVSADGKWVLATCKTYLIIIDTELKGSPNNGFSKPMGKQKPVPKKLQIRPEHIAQMGEQLSFTPAKFNVGEGNETQILTSTGRYVVSWNFRRVKLGHLYEYRIKEFPDKVVADSFRFGQHNSIVVTLPDDVTMTQKSKLHKPTTSMPSSH